MDDGNISSKKSMHAVVSLHWGLQLSPQAGSSTVSELLNRLFLDIHTHSGKAAQIFTLSQLSESKAPSPNPHSTAGLNH